MTDQSILVLCSNNDRTPAYQLLIPSLLAMLEDNGIGRNNIHFEYLDLPRAREELGKREALASALRSKYDDNAIDLLVCLNSPSLLFLLYDAPAFFPQIPVIAWEVGRTIGEDVFQRPVVPMLAQPDIQGTVDLALRLFPDTLRVIFVSDDSLLIRNDEIKNGSAFSEWVDRIQVDFITGTSIENTIDHVSHLPDHNIVIYANTFVSGPERTASPHEVGRMVAKNATVPVFVLYDTLMDQGVVGGSLLRFRQEGVRIGRMAVELLKNGFDNHPPPPSLENEATPTFDWQQIQIWGGRTNNLPEESVFINFPNAIWQRYRWQIISQTVLIFMTLLLIFSLWVQRKKRVTIESVLKNTNKTLERRIADRTEALKTSKERLKKAQEIAGVGSWEFDIEKQQLIWSDEVFRIFGLEPDPFEATYETFLKTVHPDDRRKVDHAYTNSLQGDDSGYEIEHRIVRADGEERVVHEKCEHIRNQSGAIVRSVGMVRDITDQKRAEAALQESEATYRNLFEQNHAVLLLIDPMHDGRIIDANEVACTFYGYNHDEIKGLTEHDIVLHPSEKAPGELLSSLSVCGSNRYQTHQLADGSLREVEVFCGPYSAGGKNRTYAIIHDITERRNAERELKKLNETLEQQVSERTALAETRSKQLQSLAVELLRVEERERQRFAQLLHDDLQQMLAAAKLQLQSVSYQYSEEKTISDVVGILQESIEKSRRLSRELSPPVLYHTGLSASVEWLCQQMQHQFNLDISFDSELKQFVEKTPLKAFIFRTAQELLFNIVKHADASMAQVALSGSGTDIFITISDDGRGFDPQILNQVGDRIGFGLLSIRERVLSIGGTFSIESTPGEGSRITLTIPAIEMTCSPCGQDAPSHSKGRHTAQHLLGGAKNIRVLFADDHQVMRQGLIKLIVDQPNIRIIGEASNGKEAVDITRNMQPDVVIMDVSMPEMDGVKATQIITSELPNIHVIGLSMYEDERIVRTMREAGAEAFISKTISAAELLKTIYKVCSK